MKTTYESDVGVLRNSLAKYKDKTGRKAVSLKLKIECFEAMNNLAKTITEEDIMKSTTFLIDGTS